MASWLVLAIFIWFFGKSLEADDHGEMESYAESLSAIRILYPHFQDVAPCQCDLWPMKCDIYCCCDPDCPKPNHFNSSCRQDLDIAPKMNCSSPGRLDLGDEHAILCLRNENSPILGQFYRESDVLESSVDYALKLRDWKKSDRLEPVKTEHPAVHKDRYVYGDPLKTTYDSSRGIHGTLNLPQSISGHCEHLPLEFLKDTRSLCYFRLSKESCQPDSNLDLVMFLMPNGWSSVYLPEVNANYTSPNRDADLKVNYFASAQAYKYLTLTTHIPANDRDSQVDSFEDWKNVEVIDEQRMGLRKDVEKIEKIKRPQLYNPKLKSCDDVVLEVEYHLFWNGSEITRIESDVLLGNLSLGEPALLTQKFSATFHHEATNPNLKKPPFNGNPGYVSGKYVIAGFENGAGSEFVPTLNNFAVWNPDSERSPDTFCRDTPIKPVVFGLNSMSGCIIQLSKTNFSRCSTLRKNIDALQENLVSADYVSKGLYGSLNDTSLEEYVNYKDINDTVPIIYNIETDDFEDEELFQYSSSDFCRVQSEVVIEILYTKSVHKIKRICGVQVTRKYHKWTWTCGKSSKSHDCDAIGDFELRTNVIFHEIPLVWKFQNTSRFWVLNSERFCEGDVCWGELFYPFLEELGQMRSYVVQWALILGLIFVTSVHFLKFEL